MGVSVKAGGTDRRVTRKQLLAMYGTTDPLYNKHQSIPWLRKKEQTLKFVCCSLCIDSSAHTSLMVTKAVCTGCALGPLELQTISAQHWGTSVQPWHLSWDFLALPLPLFCPEGNSYFYSSYILDTLMADGNFVVLVGFMCDAAPPTAKRCPNGAKKSSGRCTWAEGCSPRTEHVYQLSEYCHIK